MFNCFGSDYGFKCDICGKPTGSCEDYYYASDCCTECSKAVQAAREQQFYLKNLNKKTK